MDIKSLMIGDWVYNKHHGKNIRLTPYDFFTHTHNEFGEQSLLPHSKPRFGMDLEPIPITPEILEKNGFKRDLLWHHCDKDLENYSISVQLGYANRIEYIKIAEKGKDDVVPSERTKLYLTHIKYVHQFQQALRLCGINKEIVL